MQSLRSNRGGGQGIVAGIAVICIALAAYFIFQRAKPREDLAEGDVYYYCTNCEKEFVGSSMDIPPIKCKYCNQLTAAAARKFKCKACGREFIGYIQKHDPETKLLIERRRKGEHVPDEQIGSILVTVPGDENWVDASSPEGAELMSNIVCPDPNCGSTEVEPVFPPRKEK